MPDSSSVRNNMDASRYELETESTLAIAAYRMEPGRIIFTHTEVPTILRGRGIATKLIAGALADVRSRHLRIVPQCPFVADYIRSHPEIEDLLADLS